MSDTVPLSNAEWIGGLAILALCVWLFVRGNMKRRHFRALWDETISMVQEKNFEGARERLAKIVKLTPIWADAHRVLGSVLFRLGQSEEAEKELRLAMAFEPRNALAHFDLGVYLIVSDSGRLDEAFDSLAKALELDANVRSHLLELEPLARLRDHPRMKALLGE